MRLTHVSQAVGLCVFLASSAVQAAPQRVVSTHLCTDEYVFRLVPREHISALSYLAGDTNPVVSTIANKVQGIDRIRGSAEEVLTRSPDLVVMYEGTNPRLKQHLIEAGIRFVELKWSNSLADVRAQTLDLGNRLGNPEGARGLLAEMDRALAAARILAVSGPVRTLVYEPNGYATAGGITDELMAIAGLRDVASGMNPTRSGIVPVESVIVDAPELLIINGEPLARSRADLVLRHPALEALRSRITVARATLTPLLCAGPWSAAVAPVFARWGRIAAANRALRAKLEF